MNKSKVEVADIFKAHIQDYLKKYQMPKEHLKIVYDIISCRTAYLGGHIEKCDHCGDERIAYNSCCNRHCPKCQCLAKERWLEKRKEELLPVRYFHTVFTIPHEINPVMLCNKQVMLSILFKAVADTLLKFGKDPKHKLGGRIGAILFLHTWDQALMDHFHIHCLIPGGAITKDGQWTGCKKRYLFPEKALSKVFMAKFLDYLDDARSGKKLIFPGNTKTLGTSFGFDKLKKVLCSKKWVVDIEDPIDKPENVLEYVGRYTHRVAISNNRIISMKEGKVTFAYKDRKQKTIRTMTIDAIEFIRRFLLHALPKKFMRIRHIGFLANRCKKENLKKCREILKVPEVAPRENPSVEAVMLKLTGKDILLCCKCKKGRYKVIGDIPKYTGCNPFRIIHPLILTGG